MYDAVAVEVLDGEADLIRQLLDPMLRQLELPRLYVVEEVAALHIF